jgi:hypothetical protein
MTPRTTADLTCQRCGWLESSHHYAQAAIAKLQLTPDPGNWPCPEFVRPFGANPRRRSRNPLAWVSVTGWILLAYVGGLSAIAWMIGATG